MASLFAVYLLSIAGHVISAPLITAVVLTVAIAAVGCGAVLGLQGNQTVRPQEVKLIQGVQLIQVVQLIQGVDPGEASQPLP
jgi:hypothetical protein